MFFFLQVSHDLQIFLREIFEESIYFAIQTRMCLWLLNMRSTTRIFYTTFTSLGHLDQIPCKSSHFLFTNIYF